MKNYLLLLLLLVIVKSNFAQENGENKLGAWYIYSGSHIISDKFSVNSGIQLRDYETITNFNQLLLMAGLNYHINPKISTTIGYGYLNTDKSFEEFMEETNANEHRLFEQVSLKNKIWKFNLEHRYRIEQRFLELDRKTDTQYRTRYRMQITLPLSDTFSIGVYDEVFLNLQGEVFSQNRLFAALGIKIKKNSKLQLGYLKNRFRDVTFDRLQLGLFISTDNRKSKEKPYVYNNPNNYLLTKNENKLSLHL